MFSNELQQVHSNYGSRKIVLLDLLFLGFYIKHFVHAIFVILMSLPPQTETRHVFSTPYIS